MRISIVCLLAVLLTAGCGAKNKPENDAPDMTEEQLAMEQRRAEIIQRLTRHYFERVAAFRAINKKLDPDTRYIVFVGDSLTEGFDLDDFFPQIPTLNRGITADGIYNSPGMPETTGLLNRMPASIFDTQPRAIFLLIGSNHMPKEYERIPSLLISYLKVYEQTRERLPEVPFIVQTIPPAGNKRADHILFNERVREYNDRLKEFADERDLPLIDVYNLVADEQGLLREELTRDGLHFTQEAYALWSDAISDKIAELNLAEPTKAKTND